ncbi:MAG TPA: gas vesicle protein GvpJ [Pseudonocardiaceae bacterium]|nr:gas vesicle protein GvpJ [Pseudonocardiaceae bacterium]
MTTAVQPSGGGVERPTASSLADVIDTILDKGLVIDAYVRVSLVGIELLTIDARIVVASVDTYLRFAEAVNRLEISDNEPKGLPDLIEDMNEGGAKSRTKGALEAAGEKLRDFIGDDDTDHDTDDDIEDEQQTSSRRRGR